MNICGSLAKNSWCGECPCASLGVELWAIVHRCARLGQSFVLSCVARLLKAWRNWDMAFSHRELWCFSCGIPIWSFCTPKPARTLRTLLDSRRLLWASDLILAGTPIDEKHCFRALDTWISFKSGMGRRLRIRCMCRLLLEGAGSYCTYTFWNGLLRIDLRETYLFLAQISVLLLV